MCDILILHTETSDPLVFLGNFLFEFVDEVGEYRYPEAVYVEWPS